MANENACTHEEKLMTESSDKGYRFFDHTADVGLTATGKTMGELFTHAAQGLVELLVGESQIASQDTRTIQLQASSVEELLAAWLKELLYWFSTDRFLPAVYQLDEAGRTELRGRIIGETFNPVRHAPGTEVKGITRHQFTVTETPDGWAARIIFDV